MYGQAVGEKEEHNPEVMKNGEWKEIWGGKESVMWGFHPIVLLACATLCATERLDCGHCDSDLDWPVCLLKWVVHGSLCGEWRV